MSKLKQPIISLGARGSLANALTFQRAHKTDFVRKKPIPAYRRTLPQVYQRWLYMDYAYLWRQQSQATRLLYATKGYPYHLTGYQFWMKEHLQDLSDIAGMWHLDEALGAIAHDSGRNLNHGAIFGATSIDGLISRGRYFDGINDYIDCANDLSLDITQEITIEFFINELIDNGTIVDKYSAGVGAQRLGYHIWQFAGSLIFQTGIDAGTDTLVATAISLGRWYHIAFTHDGTTLRAYRDGVFDISALATQSPWNTNPVKSLLIGHIGSGVAWFKGTLDELRVYNRALTEPEIKRHSERRYP